MEDCLEIERKFLVSGDFRPSVRRSVHLVQGYICTEHGRTVRVRLGDGRGFLTIKGPGSADGIPYNQGPGQRRRNHPLRVGEGDSAGRGRTAAAALREREDRQDPASRGFRGPYLRGGRVPRRQRGARVRRARTEKSGRAFRPAGLARKGGYGRCQVLQLLPVGAPVP